MVVKICITASDIGMMTDLFENHDPPLDPTKHAFRYDDVGKCWELYEIDLSGEHLVAHITEDEGWTND